MKSIPFTRLGTISVLIFPGLSFHIYGSNFEYKIYHYERLLTQERLKVVQTAFGKDIGFSFKTFRFMDDQPSNEQTQTISCELHLDPSDEVIEEQAAKCTCYNESECLNG